MDTPPVKKGECLPGVLLIAPTDGDDASANLIRMLRATPANTDVVLVRIDAVPKKEWERDATTIHDASNHAGGSYLPGPLPRTDEIREALNRGNPCGRSLGAVPRASSSKASNRWRAWHGSASGPVQRCRCSPRQRPPPFTSPAGTTVLDPVRARAEADAAERRGAGTLWAAGPVEWEAVTAGAVSQPEVVPVEGEAGGEARRARPRIVALPRVQPRRGTEEVPTALLAAILARLETSPTATGGVPAWLVEAIGNPLTYDAAAANRMDVCVRVEPALYLGLQATKERLGLRTTVGAWEYVLRAGRRWRSGAERGGAPPG